MTTNVWRLKCLVNLVLLLFVKNSIGQIADIRNRDTNSKTKDSQLISERIIEPNTPGYFELSDQDKMWSVLSYLMQNIPQTKELPTFKSEDKVLERISEFLPYYHWVQRLRDLGMIYFDKYPNDSKRWRWLLATQTSPPDYYLDLVEGLKFLFNEQQSKIKFDSAKINKWNLWYASVKKVMLRSNELPDNLKGQIIYTELKNDLSNVVQVLRGNRKGVKNIYPFFSKVLDFAEQMPASQWPVQIAKVAIRQINDVINDTIYTVYKGKIPGTYLSKATYNFLEMMKSSPNKNLADWAVNNNIEPGIVTKARKIPLDLEFKSMDGQLIDLKNLRGKVVLLEFGGVTWCSACLRWRKDVIIPNYQKYHDKGFEIIGIVFDSYGDKEKVTRLLEKEGAKYIHWLTGSVNGNEFTSQFGISLVPQFILLNKEGLIVESTLGNEKVAKEKFDESFESMLRKYLGLN